MADSIAWTWVATSPSCLPAARVRLTPAFAASAFAASSMATKYGLVVVFTMSETPTLSDDPEPEPEPEQPARASAAMAAMDAAGQEALAQWSEVL